MRPTRQPSLLLSTLTVTLVAVLCGYTRLFLFRGTVVPLTLVLPLLLCVWSRQRWQLWGMATAFTAMSALRAFWILPLARAYTRTEAWESLGNNFVNILAGTLAVQAIMAYRDRTDEHSATISARNDAIEAQTRELAELNENLRRSNERLHRREEILEMLLQSSRAPESGDKILFRLCRRALGIIGAPATAVAILELEGGRLAMRAQAAADGGPALPAEWPVETSVARAVLGDDQTHVVSDLAREPDLAAPFQASDGVRALLAAPVRFAGAPGGIILACSGAAAEWTEEQLRIIEWLGAQCSHIIEGIRRQQALAGRAREVEAANRAKDNFIAMLSHELRTPLTPVMAVVGALEQDERLSPEMRADVEMIRRNISVQSRLIDDLLDLTRITRGSLSLADLEPVEIVPVLRDAASVVESERNAKQQGLEMRLERLEGCVVAGDAARLQQVFWNLLKNAVKFSPPGSRIVVSGSPSEADPRSVAIDVSDNGIGIDSADLERIFLPFEQVASEGKRRGSGTGHGLGLGLGLGIAKAIAELHSGSIRVFSEGAGKGARFTVELPLAAQHTPRAEAPQEAPPEPAARGPVPPLRILLVEDHADTSRAMARLLKRAGNTVETAENAAAAAALFRDKPFDLVISDLGLPDESGLELMRKLRAAKSGILGICLSGYGTEDDLRDCRDAGFSEHLTKPVDMGRLQAAISRVVSKADRSAHA